MTISVKGALLKNVSDAIVKVQEALDGLTALHPIAAHTDVYKMLVKSRTDLREILMQLNKVKL